MSAIILTRAPAMTAEQAGGQNVLAFMNTIAFTEGTDNNRQKTNCFGYDVIVGGELFTDFKDHPNKLVKLNANLSSTAAGRYQILYRFWVIYKKQLNLPDFSPFSQDLYCRNILKEQRAIEPLLNGDFELAIKRTNNIWASLPDSPYGQHTYSMDEAKGIYVMNGGTYR